MQSNATISPRVEPVSDSDRITTIDGLRGIAILGILLMNIQGFGLPHLLVSDISAWDEKGLNYYTWYVFGPGVLEGSMRAIFSMLFGAGITLFISRLEKTMTGLRAIGLFFRRQLWLLLFGLFNAYILLWSWDILLPYAICGLLTFPFRKLKPKYLLLIATLSLLLITASENLQLLRQKTIIAKGEKIAAIDTAVIKLTQKQKEFLTAMNEIRQRSNPEEKKKKIEKQIAEVRGNFIDIYKARHEIIAEEETKATNNFVTWDILLFIFIGMAFFKMGILQGEAKVGLYAWMAVLGLGTGLPLSFFYLEPELHYHHNYFEIFKNKQFEFYELQRFVHSIGVFGLIMLMYKSQWFKWLFAKMRPVGQMAFTNYLMQSLLCGLFFYGVGFGMFGKLQRYELYYVVLAIWIIEIVCSYFWLTYFRFGPFEWIWRSLTYWKWQPMKKETTK